MRPIISTIRPVAAAALVVAFSIAATPLLAITIGGESRLTQEQFAKKNGKSLSDVRKNFAASGTLECREGRRRYRLTAELVGRNDIVVTAAHAFIDTGTCKKIVRPDQCTFNTHDGRQSVSRRVQILAIGDVRCEPTRYRGDADWVVLKLHAPIATIVPYDFGEWKHAFAEARVLSIAAQSDDFFLNGRRTDTKTIDDCKIRRLLVMGFSVRLLTDCDTGPGNSGGALLASAFTGVPQLLGITVATSVPPRDAKPRRGAPRDGAYQERTWSAHAVPLAGAFLNALERANGRAVSNSSFYVGYPVATSPIAPIIPGPRGGPFLPFTRINTPFPPIPRPPQLCDERVALDECWTVGAAPQ